MTGAWRLIELLDEFDEFDEPDEFELLPVLAPEPGLAEPALDGLVPDAGVPAALLPDELELLVVVCVEPGSAAATAPAASRLATPTVAVVVFSLR
ncbi:MAG: hypothetical protein ACRDL9_09135, partial [Trebonia sp.]